MPDIRFTIGGVSYEPGDKWARVRSEIRLREQDLDAYDVIELDLVIPATSESSLKNLYEAAIAKMRDLLRIEVPGFFPSQ
ncbi:MAG: hypothetical protein ACLFVT_07450 [Syntrophobacteria bacterium]